MDDNAEREKQARILDAALEKFSAYGFARTSMADIAAAAGMSRPALYHHYGNKEEIFRAMLGRILDTAADDAVAALTGAGDLRSRIDGFLQRWSGDLAESFRSTQHGADLVEAKAGYAKPVVDAANQRVRRALMSALGDVADDPAPLVDLVLLSPLGLKYDDPSMPKLRRRLTTLADSVARAAEG